ncbi:hypothetical protein S245_001284 [Arachis hypogaea]
MNSLGFLLSLLVLVAFSIVQLVHGNAELRALMDLKSSLDPEGKILSSWSSDGDPCSGLFQKRPVFSWSIDGTRIKYAVTKCAPLMLPVRANRRGAWGQQLGSEGRTQRSTKSLSPTMFDREEGVEGSPSRTCSRSCCRLQFGWLGGGVGVGEQRGRVELGVDGRVTQSKEGELG